MIDEKPNDKEIISALVEMNGGLVAVCGASGLKASHVSYWLSGKKNMSPQRQATLRNAIGLEVSLRPTSDRIHIWRPRHISANLSLSLTVFFPEGGLYAPAPWSSSFGFRDRPGAKVSDPEVFAFVARGLKVVLIAPPFSIESDALFPGMRRPKQASKELELSLSDGLKPLWLNGTIDTRMFEAAWPQPISFRLKTNDDFDDEPDPRAVESNDENDKKYAIDKFLPVIDELFNRQITFAKMREYFKAAIDEFDPNYDTYQTEHLERDEQPD